MLPVRAISDHSVLKTYQQLKIMLLYKKTHLKFPLPFLAECSMFLILMSVLGLSSMCQESNRVATSEDRAAHLVDHMF